MRKIAMIPARYAATRFPYKLMQPLGNKTVIRQTYDNTVATGLFDEVIVVTDSEIILNEIRNNGGKAMMSIKQHESGSDRIAEAVSCMDVDIILNVQGDEPFVQKETLRKLLAAFDDKQVQVASVMKKFTDMTLVNNPNYVKVVVDKNMNSLYFSRTVIPFLRDESVTPLYYEHIGVYAFRKEALLNFTSWEATYMEKAEKLEQLRYLENGIQIRMLITEEATVKIDVPEDLEKAEEYYRESIYLNSEIGNNNFTNLGSAIQQIFFLLNTEGLNSTINNFSVYMKNVPAGTTTFTGNGTYSLAGYTQVFSGTYTATPAGFSPIILTTPFIHTAGMNIQVLIIRADNVLHTGYVYQASVGNESDATGTLTTTRRYNSTVAPAAGSTMLAASNFRPAIVFNHTWPIDAVANDIILPRTSCYSTPQSIDVEVFNGGTLSIAAGAVNVTFKVRGANTFTGSLTNTAIIPAFSSEFITFTGINLNNQGINFDTAYVSLTGDGTTWNDTITTASANAAIISTFPVTENVEEFYPIIPTSDLDVFRYTEILQFDELWGLWHGDYFNADQTAHLVPLGWPVDSAFYLYDSYSGASSDGFESRLFSECIDLTSATAALLSFQMSHDNTFLTTLDSIYVSVSADQGVTWTRLQGFQRPDATAVTPTWRLHSINLASYLGQKIQIGFEGVSKYGNAIALDNISITATLPVTVLSFNAQRNGRVNDLNWRTAQELNSSRFVIERSTDGGLHYTDIGQVAAAGNSSTERNYRFTDMNPVKGINYYRLRIVDLDNKFKYSEIKNVRNMGTSDMVFANPVQQRMDIKLDVEKADKASISITDMNGKIVYSNTVNVSEGSNNLSLETARYAPGLYIIQVQLSDNRITRKFSKL